MTTPAAREARSERIRRLTLREYDASAYRERQPARLEPVRLLPGWALALIWAKQRRDNGVGQ